LGTWDQQIILSTSNIIHSFECVYKKGEDGKWNSRDLDFHKKLQKVQDYVARFSNNKTKIVSRHMQALKTTMQQHMGGGVVWLLEKAQVLGIPGFGNEGGYGEICKVRISRMTNIPTIVNFDVKMSKAASKKAKQVERSVEALACLIKHPRLIKFWVVNFQTMEVYTLWWNGKSLRNFWNTYSKVSEAMEN
jgi:hypothetical protein